VVGKELISIQVEEELPQKSINETLIDNSKIINFWNLNNSPPSNKKPPQKPVLFFVSSNSKK